MCLARGGVGTITLVDNDTVSESNINRQLIALTSTIGQNKTDVMKERILEINPECDVTSIPCFYTKDKEVCIDGFDYVVDAIDTVTSKLLIIKKCKELDIPVISSMGTGNKLDPSKLLITDITKTSICPLAKIVRKKCRDLGIKHLTVLTSTEEPIKTHTRNPGSMIFVPASAGLMIASYILKFFIGDSYEKDC